MTTAAAKKARGIRGGEESIFSVFSRVILIATFDLGVAWFVSNAFANGYDQLALVVIAVGVMLNLIFILPQAYAYRWMALGLSFLILFTIYPIFFTIYVAFTNYGDGHLLTKEQAIKSIQETKYLAESGKSFSWTAFKSAEGQYALWLVDPSGATFLAKQGETIVPALPGDPGVGEADAKGIPQTIEGYTRLNVLLAASDKTLTSIQFGAEGEQAVQVRNPSAAAELQIRYVYDEAADTMTDQSNGDVYYNNAGTFATNNGKSIKPGFRAQVGLKNFTDFLISPTLRGPLVRIMIWNFVFPTISVISTFFLGLGIAIMFNEEKFPLKRTIRTLLLIPYTIPSLITILIWKGMMNPEFGIINRSLESLIGWAPPWTTQPIWAQSAVLIVNLWLGYPYMMLVTSGALQSIPADLYEAATVDGSTGWHSFRKITLPLLLVAVGPLLIASFVFNFNNFNLIYLFINGGPPIVGASTQAGHTDILISYVYNLAFASGGRGVQYGLASAISIVIFAIVGAITLFQYRFTSMWEEVGEGV